MVYLLLLAGVFMGWSLGTNDGANAFGTAVATGVVKYRTAIAIISVFVIIGAFVAGSGNLTNISSIATNNEVMASTEMIDEAVKNGTTENLVLKTALKATIIFICSGITVFLMSYLKFPVSANQSITGAVIGWGLFYANYDNPEVLSGNLRQIGKFVSTWLLNPIGAVMISFLIILFANEFIIPKLYSLTFYDQIIKTGYIAAGVLASYSIGTNSSANVTALYFDAVDDGVRTNLLEDARLTATIGGIAIALGVLTYSKKVMMTVGSGIVPLTQIEGFLVIIAMAVTILIMEKAMGIPVSTSQAVVGAVVGAGLTKGIKNVNFGVFKNIAIAWVGSPLMAGVLAYIVALATQSYFG